MSVPGLYEEASKPALSYHGLPHTTVTSFSKMTGPLPPGQDGLKLPLGPGLRPPLHLSWSQSGSGSGTQHDRAPHSALLEGDFNTPRLQDCCLQPGPVTGPALSVLLPCISHT